ncbi:MAG TPA: hypothetical protein PK325_13900 [Cyclobacteriaceae bacterium]|nr:hypothetical protein [Cyclobacteriaceae bacterium]HMV09195.1 hypothetical protein [Cyclobacteriaceae bacterium]HMV90321.1 hypothetical protein [Cyclobacteriaceae bacterium]HMX01436.1 hypothetical protein [Cyclobacteriaceae bacterium]HMX50294.1 hypothetical protein [Cyclobacteriaceae bacterium]
MTASNKPSVAFWIISGLALIWNLMGVMAYIELVTGPSNEMPKWATVAFAIAVWGSTLGCLLLLLRKKFAKPVFAVSLAGILVQMSHVLFISKSYETTGPGGVAMPVMIILIGGFLVWYSRYANEKGWLS